MLNNLRISTKTGIVQGHNITSRLDRNNRVCNCNVDVFYGIPYAKPPIGDLRWKPAEPVQPWSYIADNKEHGVAMQVDFYGTPDFDCSKMNISEDCLYLDIWAPADIKRENLPVLVWVHGGGWQSGSSLLKKYDGSALASKGAIVVSIEYRIGVFGFLSHPLLSAESEKGTSGNYGLTDVREALCWIKNNISFFGGDPNKVTVFGQSSGGNLVKYIVASSYFNGVCDGACVHSGTGAPTSPLQMKDAELNGKKFTTLLGASTIEEMRAMDAYEILKLYAEQYSSGQYVAEPVIDGDILPDDSFKLFRDGNINDIPVIFSTTAHDTPLFMDMQAECHEDIEGYDDIQNAFSQIYPGSSLDSRSYEYVINYLNKNYGVEDATALSQIFLEDSSGNTLADEDLRQAFWRILNFDRPLTKATYYTQRAMDVNKNNAYLCTWERIIPGWKPLNIGAFHEIELSYLFDCHWDGYPLPKPTPWDDKLIDIVQRLWISFADKHQLSYENFKWPAFNGYQAIFGDKDMHLEKVNKEAFDIFIKHYHEKL